MLEQAVVDALAEVTFVAVVGTSPWRMKRCGDEAEAVRFLRRRPGTIYRIDHVLHRQGDGSLEVLPRSTPIRRFR